MDRSCLEDSQGKVLPNPAVCRPVVVSLIEQAERRLASGDYEQSESLFQAAVAADVTPTAQIAYGVHLFERDRDEEAEVQLQQAWAGACRAGDPIGRAIACSNLALLFLSRGDLIRAKQFEQLAIGAWLERQPVLWSHDASAAQAALPSWLRRLAAAGLFASGEDDEASRLLASDTSSSPDSPESWFDAGTLAERTGDIARSLQCFDKGLEAARRCGDTFGEAACLERLASLWRKSGHFRRADRALQAAEEIHDRCRRFRARHRCQSARSALAPPLVLMDTDPGLN